MNKQVTMSLPDIPGFEYTGEYRSVKQGDYYQTVDNSRTPCFEYWDFHYQSGGQFPILRKLRNVEMFNYRLNATEIYTQEVIDNIPPDFEIVEFRYPRVGEKFISKNGVIADWKVGDRSYFFYPVLIIERKVKK